MLSFMLHYNCSVVRYFTVFTFILFPFDPLNKQARGQDKYYTLFIQKELTYSYR